MAQLFNTYGEWYQGLTSPQEKSYGGAEQQDAGVTAQGQSTEASPQATQAPRAPSTEPTIFKAPAPNSGGIFSGITEGAQKAAPEIADLGKAFKEQAGPSRTFEGIGGEAPLKQAVESGQGMDTAKGMLSAKYTGPQTLEQAETVNISNMLKGFQGQAEGSRTLEGAMSLLQPQATGGATPGKLRAEALGRLKSEGYKAEAQKARDAVTQSLGMLNMEKAGAEAFAKQRTAEEDAIRNLSKQYLQGRETGLTGELDTAVAAEEAKQAKAQELWNAFGASNDRSKLTELEALAGGLGGIQSDPEEALNERLNAILGSERYAELAGIPELVANEGLGKKSKFAQDWYNTTGQKLGKQELRRLETLARARQKELDAARAEGAAPDSLEKLFAAQDIGSTAQAKYNEMMADPQYAEIADVPLLELGISKHGRRTYARPKGLTEKQYKLAWKRQQDLERVFGSQTKGGGEEQFTGEFQNVMPLNFAGGPAAGIEGRVYQSQDITQPDYLRLDTGLDPSRQTVGTVEQKQQYNRIEELLNQANRLQETEPEKSTQLLADVDKYLADQEAELGARGKDLSESQLEWQKQLKKARSKYRKTRQGLAGIGTVVSNTMGKMGVPAALRGPLTTGALAAFTGGIGGLGAAGTMNALPASQIIQRNTLGV